MDSSHQFSGGVQVLLQRFFAQRSLDTQRITGLNVIFRYPLTEGEKGGKISVPFGGILKEEFKVMDASQGPTGRQQETLQVFLYGLLEVKSDNREGATLIQQNFRRPHIQVTLGKPIFRQNGISFSHREPGLGG